MEGKSDQQVQERKGREISYTMKGKGDQQAQEVERRRRS